MIILEITDETGITHYEILALSPENLADVADKALAKTIRTAAKKARRRYNKAAQKGDREAEGKMARINEAETVLKNPKDREIYDEELESGKGATLDVLRVQQIASPFFWDRNARFRVIERLMREAGLTRPIPVSLGL